MGENRLAARATAPGTILKRELEARGWSQKDLSAIVGRPEKTISAIMQGRKAITPETATGLSAALGTSADFPAAAKYYPAGLSFPVSSVISLGGALGLDGRRRDRDRAGRCWCVYLPRLFGWHDFGLALVSRR